MAINRRDAWITGLVQLISMAFFLSFIAMQTRLMSGLESGAAESPVLLATVLLLALYILLEAMENRTREYVYASCVKKTKRKAAEAFLRQTWNTRTTEESISYFSNEIGTVLEQNVYLGLFIQKQLIFTVLSFCMLFALVRAGSLVILLSAVLFGWVMHTLGKTLPEKQRAVLSEKAGFLAVLLELHRGLGEIHINQMEPLAEEDFIQANRASEQAGKRYKAALNNLETLGAGQNMLIYIFILIAGGLLASKGVVGVGVFVSAAELSVQALSAWSTIMKLYPIVKSSQPMKKELEALIACPGGPFREVLPASGDVLAEVRNLDIQYGQAPPLIKNINFSIQKGKKYLLTGDSGCGKSSLAGYLSGLLRGESGEVLVYTRRIAYVPQTPFLFPGTLRENLTLGQEIGDDVLRDMMRRMSLSLSLDMVVAPEGNNLSGGEKARAALARALLTDPEVLIIDEVTANLDSGLEEQVENLLLTECPNMALFQIAHGVKAPERFDTVFQVKEHRLLEVGK